MVVPPALQTVEPPRDKGLSCFRRREVQACHAEGVMTRFETVIFLNGGNQKNNSELDVSSIDQKGNIQSTSV